MTRIYKSKRIPKRNATFNHGWFRPIFVENWAYNFIHYSEQLDPTLNVNTHYVELTGKGLVKTGKNPVKVFGQYWAQFSKMQALNKILGCEVSNFGLRLSPINVEPNSADWFDVRVNPLIVSSTKCYYVNLVWRNRDINKAIKTFSKMDDTIANLILEVEKG